MYADVTFNLKAILDATKVTQNMNFLMGIEYQQRKFAHWASVIRFLHDQYKDWPSSNGNPLLGKKRYSSLCIPCAGLVKTGSCYKEESCSSVDPCSPTVIVIFLLVCGLLQPSSQTPIFHALSPREMYETSWTHDGTQWCLENDHWIQRTEGTEAWSKREKQKKLSSKETIQLLVTMITNKATLLFLTLLQSP